jgi:hypothetical protein
MKIMMIGDIETISERTPPMPPEIPWFHPHPLDRPLVRPLDRLPMIIPHPYDPLDIHLNDRAMLWGTMLRGTMLRGTMLRGTMLVGIPRKATL